MSTPKTRDDESTSTKDTDGAERARRAAERVRTAEELVAKAKRAERQAQGGEPLVELTKPRHVDDPDEERAT